MHDEGFWLTYYQWLISFPSTNFEVDCIPVIGQAFLGQSAPDLDEPEASAKDHFQKPYQVQNHGRTFAAMISAIPCH